MESIRGILKGGHPLDSVFSLLNFLFVKKSLYGPKDNIKIHGFNLRYSLQNKAIYKEILIAPDPLFYRKG